MNSESHHGTKQQGPERLAFLFPGQGSQSVRMLAKLKAAWPVYAEALSEFAPMFEISPGLSVLSLIEKDRNEASENQLMQTENAQPALGLIESSLLKALEKSGIHADIYAGHSYGELVALHAAGFYDVATLAKLSRARGEILAQASEKNPSRMLAVKADAKTMEDLLSAYKGVIELANLNSPKQTVIGGRADALPSFVAKCAELGIKSIPLKTAAAFHTSLMEPALAPWTQALSQILQGHFKSSSKEVFANRDGQAYPGDEKSLIESLSKQIATPVQWVKTIEGLYASGVRIFLEVGPGKALTNLCTSILQGKADILCLTLDPGTDAKDIPSHIEELKQKISSRRSPPVTQANSVTAPLGEPTANLELIRRYLEVSETVTLQMAKDLPLDQKQMVLDQYLKSTEAVMQSFLHLQTGGTLPIITAKAEPSPPQTKIPEALTPLSWFKAKIAHVTGYSLDRIDENKGFDSFGIDSITLMECLAELIEVYPELKAHKTALYSLRNLNELKGYHAETGSTAANDKSSAAERKVRTRKKSDRFSPTVNRIMSRLILSFASTGGRKPEEFVLHANLEQDLNIDAFTRQEAIEDVLRAYPRFALAGQALLNASSLGELGELLDRFDDLRSINLSPSIAQAARLGHKGVERFVLRTLREPDNQTTNSIQIPEDILLVGAEGPFLLNLKATIEHQGSEIQVLAFSDTEWTLERHATKASRFNSEALAEVLQRGGQPEALRFVIFVLETDDTELLSPRSEAWQKQLDKGPIALFELAKAMKFAQLFQRGDSLSLIGLEAGNTAWQATRGTLKSIARENSQLVCTSLRLHLSASRISRRRILETLITHQGQHEVYLSSSELTVKVLEHEALNEGESLKLPPKALILITGGATGVSASLAIELVSRYPGLRVAALGRSPYPSAEDSDAKALAMQDTKARIIQAGGSFLYLSCDVRDEEKLSSSIDSLIAEQGPIHGYIHGAGVSDDALMSRKSFESFKTVLETKTLALPLLFHKLKGQPLAFVVFMSSLSSLNGTPGQTDYSAANEALNGVAELWQTQLSCRVTSLLWSVWGETGLASEDLIHRMHEVGLDTIATNDGVRSFLLELGQDSRDSWVLLSPFSTLYYTLEIDKEHFALPEEGA